MLKGARGIDSMIRETRRRVDLPVSHAHGCPSTQPQIADGPTWSMSEIDTTTVICWFSRQRAIRWDSCRRPSVNVKDNQSEEVCNQCSIVRRLFSSSTESRHGTTKAETRKFATIGREV